MSSDVKFAGVGDAIRETRERCGVSLSALARNSGISKGTLSKYETDELNVSVETLETLASALGCGFGSLVVRCLVNRYPSLFGDDPELSQLLKSARDELEKL